ncbi:fic/DOC family protein [bacterium BMS3Bbin11]|nr:fic/DOC family protein [bacterium BMS3Abin11]GBE45505.1 fic/DOC family protein [bacterium BMS3Bbin11]GMT41459.1 MAG: cell filamentation protein [bacterium]HDH16570.1 mobile mystery protein B [Gammaproteobacteria bacterium]
MTDPLLEQDGAATPLTAEEREELIPAYITLRRELNEAEQTNILAAEQWAFLRKRDVLKQQFLSNLHKRMFGRVWRWAGKFRQTERNIGIPAYKIPNDLQLLLDDCRYWIEHSTYEPDEIASRFHHRLVEIHPFPNGNGRHARLATDLLLKSLGQERFTWGQVSLIDAGEARKTYVSALRAADKHNIKPLMKFVRS